jgi:C1A family cysteine protease
VEGLQAIRTKSAAVSLSAQFLLDCTYILIDQSSDCSSGNRYAALSLIKKTGGIPSESEYPYQGVRSSCDHSKFSWSAQASRWFRLQPFNVTNLKLGVSFQPILVSIGVDDDFVFWDPTVHPIYYGPGNMTRTHAVVIVGYGSDDLGEMYWIVKNSWGSAWGNNGYIFISAEANTTFVGKEGVAAILSSMIQIPS